MTDSLDRGLDALGLFEELRETLFRYYDTPFGLANAALQKKRRELLDRDGGAWRTPLLEIRPRYESSGRSIAESVADAGSAPELTDLLTKGMLSGIPQLYRHQHEALISAFRDDKDVVITAGTGSGKTESFMLPVLADLVRESAAWTGTPTPYRPWWGSDTGDFVAQRLGETGHPAAVRAMILYPMNALVDDQLTRLRKALDSDAVRHWLKQNRTGHRFYFGRYTGATPVQGEPTSKPALKSLRSYLRQTERRSRSAQELGGEAQYFIPRLDGAEMLSRWDMINTPPDILITNYSMLNVMLLRPREAGFFDKTRAWLERTPGAKFTLVIDELHTYRGTAGTEIAYLLRSLFYRLGLDEHPERLRVLAASASLDDKRDVGFLAEFFGIPRDRFRVLSGSTAKSPAGLANAAQKDVPLLKALGAAPEAAEVAAVLASDAPKAFESALLDANRGTSIARSADQIGAAMFPDSSADDQRAALSGLLRALRLADDSSGVLPKLRSHLFFRNIAGMWACSDPSCGFADREDDTDRTVGRLYAEPATRCLCGARVLELLYCQTCGDVFLGGFTGWEALRANKFDGSLLSDSPELNRLPDQIVTKPTAANYLVYWPRNSKTELDSLKSTRDEGRATFEFTRSKYDPAGGRLENIVEGSTGWSFHTRVTGKLSSAAARKYLEKLSPFPTECPACGDDLEIKRLGKEALAITHPLRLRSPIRTMRTGFEKLNQVLATSLMASLPERKLVVFSDSRQDAAKISGGLALRHYQDLLRLLLTEELGGQGNPAADFEMAKALVSGADIDRDAAKAAGRRLQKRHPLEFARIKDIWTSDPFGPDPDPLAEAELGALLRSLPDLEALADTLEPKLLALGVNPGGPKSSLQESSEKADAARSRWPEVYNWRQDDLGRRIGLTGKPEELADKIRESLREELLLGLFAAAGRDAESLGLGWLCRTDDESEIDVPLSSDAALIRSSLRVLAHQRRFSGMRWGAEDPPAPLRRYWEAVGKRHGIGWDEIRVRVQQGWAGTVADYIVNPSKVGLRPGTGQSWTCANCSRRHLHPGTGVCTKCRKDLPTEPEQFSSDEDYYAWLAANGIGKFPLRTAELTGQTDRLEAQGRQARFQKVFLSDSEQPEADEIDLLSVTTTMEAGVDIGALSAVLMANMPPTRFNYQQRVGRAGRRGSPVAVALTVCRGRSHDEYYFQAPEKITNDETPKPYLSMDRPEIYVRVLNAEVLRMAFAEVSVVTDEGTSADPTRNVHGQFGLTRDWPAARPGIATWLGCNERRIRAAAAALAIGAGPAVRLVDPVAHFRSVLVQIDAAVQRQPGHQDLSQRLAEAGMLPMFGFPTGVRYLYTRFPSKSFPWPPPGVVDRDLAIAISQFAPGSETVRDGSVYTSIGVTAFKPSGSGQPTPEAEPLGGPRPIAVCSACSHISDDGVPEPGGNQPLICPACGSDDGEFRIVDLREPAGFRTWIPRDFDGNFTFTPRAMAARTAADLVNEAPERTRANRYVVHAGRGRRFTVNDNGGQLFRFQKSSPTGMPWGGYVSLDALDDLGLPQSLAASGTPPIEVGLGTAQHSDMFFFGSDAPEIPDAGLLLGLTKVRQPSGFVESRQGRRAAWHSLAAALRETAGPHLDVQPLELAAGIHGAPGQQGGKIYAFLTDTLENGAGYCGHLAENLPAFMGAVDAYFRELEADPEHVSCSASCYRCLRDYTNMSSHALLDWRLARDLFGVLRGSDLAIDPGWYSSLITAWAETSGGDEISTPSGPAAVYEDPFGGRAVIVPKHPLESANETSIAKRLLIAADDARSSAGCSNVLFIDHFVLDRIPGAVLTSVEDFIRTM